MNVDCAFDFRATSGRLCQLLRIGAQELLKVQAVDRDSRSRHAISDSMEVIRICMDSLQVKDTVAALHSSPYGSLPCGLDLSPKVIGLMDKEFARLSQRTKKILLQTQLAAILEHFPAIDIGLNTKRSAQDN